jgi:hypothetical protein
MHRLLHTVLVGLLTHEHPGDLLAAQADIAEKRKGAGESFSRRNFTKF